LREAAEACSTKQYDALESRTASGSDKLSSADCMNDSDLIKSKIRREPFCAFVIELRSGTQLLIDRDSEILLSRKRPELIIAFTGDGLMHEFEVSAIAQVVEAT
jgi:hypothetical protein